MPLRVPDRTATAEEIELVAAIRGGDEKAFTTVVERNHQAMMALAKAYVLTPDVAAQIVHDAWMAALAGSDGFDGGTPLRTWLLRYVARSAAPLALQPEGRAPGTTGPAVDAERFRGRRDAFPGHWRSYPRDWRALPDDIRRGDDALRVVADTIEALPIEERTVITLRDVLRCSLRDACAVLELSQSAARHRLHQARSRVRAALERHFDG
jgi:RNA polymerase sigma-70 factor, ECF subfamily